VTQAFATFAAAAHTAAVEVDERPNDRLRSFLEATLEGAIARHLPGRSELAQQRRGWAVNGFDPHPFGVDIDWRHGNVHAGVEVKVTDVLDSLFDVVKLATALSHGLLDEGVPPMLRRRQSTAAPAHPSPPRGTADGFEPREVSRRLRVTADAAPARARGRGRGRPRRDRGRGAMR